MNESESANGDALDSGRVDVASCDLSRQRGQALALRVRVRCVDGEAGEALGKAQSQALRATMAALGLVSRPEDEEG